MMVLVAPRPTVFDVNSYLITQASYGIGKVISSKSTKHEVGALVIGNIGWREYAVVSEDAIRPVP
jgi:NADPH-dependent curcumin reductase CurA